MDPVERLLERNRAWVARTKEREPALLAGLARVQRPAALWIGCSDSRVAPEILLDLRPGEILVHRNVANLVPPDDPSSLAVIRLAVDDLRVADIVVCGHHLCRGIRAAVRGGDPNRPGGWLRGVEEVAARYRDVLEAIPDEEERLDRLAEINAIEQVRNVCRSSPVVEAWERGEELRVHAWASRIREGLVVDLGATVAGPGEAEKVFRRAITSCNAPCR